MDGRRHVEKVLSVLDTNKCGFFTPSDRVPARVLFKYESGTDEGGFSLVPSFASEEIARRILSWLRANADPEQFGCGLNQAEDVPSLIC
jgi:hypothetical protein